MFKTWKRSEILFLLLSLAAIALIGILFKAYWVSVIASLMGIIAGVLNMRADPYSYAFYIIQAVLYSYVSFHNKFYGEAILSGLYLFPLYTYSFFKWTPVLGYLNLIKNKGKNAKEDIKIEGIKENNRKKDHEIYAVDMKMAVLLVIAGIVITVGYGFFLSKIGSNLPYLNAFATFISLGAGFLLSRRIKEQWIFWISYSLLLSIIWISTLQKDMSQITLILQNIPFLIINVIGLVKWNAMYKEDRKIV